MRHTAHSAGFSLMEVNMAVFVMAVGILGMVALFPLGLREGMQARADLKQAMFADHALNQIVAILSQTNMTWSKWQNLDGFEGDIDALESKLPSGLMPQVKGGSGGSSLGATIWGNWTVGVDGTPMRSDHFHITCATPVTLTRVMLSNPNLDRYDMPTARILGVTVRVTDTDDRYPSSNQNEQRAWKTRYPPYYAEVLFNGIP